MNLLSGLQILQNVHPLFVHFPIALILVTLLFEGLWWVLKKEQFRTVATYLLYLSAISALAAVITGYMASGGLGHDAPGHDFVHEHRDIMLWMSGALLVTAVLVGFVRSFRAGKMRRLLIVALIAISGLLVYGADKGGRLVFEFGLGVKAVSEQAESESTGHGHEEEGMAIPDNRTSTPDSSKKPSGHADGHKH